MIASATHMHNVETKRRKSLEVNGMTLREGWLCGGHDFSLLFVKLVMSDDIKERAWN